MEKWFSILLPRFGFVSQGRQTWAAESIVLVHRATRWWAIGLVVKCVQHPSIRVAANHTLCSGGGIPVPHNFARDESTTTRVVGMCSDSRHCDTAEIWSVES